MSCPSFSRSLNCTDTAALPRNITTDSEPYSDISGVGVLTGFVGTGYLVWLLVVVKYFIAFDPTQNPYRPKRYEDHDAGYRSVGGWKPNPIDIMFLSWARRQHKGFSYLQAPLNESILALCDIQIFTGLGILISAFLLGFQCGLDAYHWQIVVYLAYFSAITHLAGLTVLQSHHNHRWTKYARIVLMFTLIVMLLVALVPTTFFNWIQVPDNVHYTKDYGILTAARQDSIALCYLDVRYGRAVFESEAKYFETLDKDPYFYPLRPFSESYSLQVAVFSMVLLLFNFTTRSLKLFKPLSSTFFGAFRRSMSSWCQKALAKVEAYGDETRCTAFWTMAISKPALATFLMLRMHIDLACSTIAELFWLTTVLLWGTLRLVKAREAIDALVLEDENQWTFGQILPVLLLAGPIFAISSSIVSSVLGERRVHQNLGSTLLLDDLSRRSQGSSIRHLDLEVDSLLDNTAVPERHSRPPLNQSRFETSHWLSRDCYSSTRWMWLCILCVVLELLFFTVILFLYTFTPVSRGVPISMSYFFYGASGMGVLYYLVFSYPSACIVIFLLGIRMDPWFQSPTRMSWKCLGFFFLSSICLISSYTVPLVLIYPTTSLRAYDSPILNWIACPFIMYGGYMLLSALVMGVQHLMRTR